MPTLEIFSQGEEVITGQVADTNAAWLSQQAVELGFNVTRHTAVGDKLADLIILLTEIAKRSDCCICSGGLGPTSDDLTAEAVSQAFDLPLEFDEQAFAHIQAYFQRRQIVMPESNRKQAMLPRGATRIDNPVGTAAGFCLTYRGCWFVFLPGVPYEMRHLFSHWVKADLSRRFVLAPARLVTLKTYGVGESQLQQTVQALELPVEVQVGFRATVEENQLKLLFAADYPSDEIQPLVTRIRQKLGAAVFGIDGLGQSVGNLSSVVAELMSAQAQTLAVFESASCGLFAAQCVGQNWLLEASYQHSLTDFSPATVLQHALNLAQALHNKTAASLILIQLYTGTFADFVDATQTTPLYTVLWTRDGFCQQTKNLAGLLERKQQLAAFSSLDLLRRFLQHHETLCPY